MKIEHIAVWVRDLEVMKNFYQSYFKMTCNEKYINEKKGFSSYFLSFNDGARLEIMHRNDILEHNFNRAIHYGFTHLSISVDGKENVDLLTEKLRNDCYIIAGEARTTGDGFYESVILDPEGNSIEITE